MCLSVCMSPVSNELTSVKVGDHVRVKPTVTTPKYKWGSVARDSIGFVTGETTPTHMTADDSCLYICLFICLSICLFIYFPKTHTRLMALCPGLPGWAGTRKVNQSGFLAEARDSEWQWHQLGHNYMQVCTSLQIHNHARTPPLNFFTGWMPFLLPNQQHQSTEG